ncbi:hypothetical protein PoB_007101000 [Plakobranchus ocellatus]|uniref:Uncharacterized protein n=1 Tax=Plakobranchus ocellatus TaxID=259542 RepID=A0AAV4DKG2_9GAST|nr:hypothetical protein PoB_007101000 [Plakobranchus ocellatus]
MDGLRPGMDEHQSGHSLVIITCRNSNEEMRAGQGGGSCCRPPARPGCRWGARTLDRRVRAYLRIDSLSTIPTMSQKRRRQGGGRGEEEKEE